MTYAVIARCSRSGQFGIGIASYSIAVGLTCDGALRANTGATLTQGAPNRRNNYLAISLLGQGHTARQALAELLANDPDCEYRQVAVVDREDRAVVYSGGRVRQWAGHRTGSGYAAFGDMLAGKQVLDALVTGFEASPQADLDERLLQALEAASSAGGMAGSHGRLPARSAALIVWGNRAHNELDIRVDLHERAVTELKRVHRDYKPSIAYYEERARNPRNAIPAMEFADLLKARQEKEAG
jgi:uncharacterized Ntn-hydrolase superfamily protein